MKSSNNEPSFFLQMHWQYLRDYFNINILRFFIAWFAVVPAILLLTANLPKTLGVVVGGKTYGLNLTLPVKWEVLWISSVIYIAAFALTSFFRPSFIKKYPNFTKYKAEGHAPRWVVWELFYALKTDNPDKLIERLITKGRVSEIVPGSEIASTMNEFSGTNPLIKVLASETAVAFPYQGRGYVFALGEGSQNIETIEKDTFWEVFGHFARSRPCLRCFICLMIAMSAALFGIAILQNIYHGFLYMVR